MKGRGFSRDAGADKAVAASAAEEMSGAEQTFHESLKRLRKMALLSVEILPTAFHQGLKPFDSVAFMYGLKPVPFRTKVPPLQNGALCRGPLISHPCFADDQRVGAVAGAPKRADDWIDDAIEGADGGKFGADSGDEGFAHG